MLFVADIAEHQRRAMTVEEQGLFVIDKLNVCRSDIPAVTHVDYSARVQTIHADTNPRFHALIAAFKEQTGCPVLVNTSFNVRGEPIVCTPEDAFRCFMGSDIDVLVVGNCLLRKKTRTRCCSWITRTHLICTNQADASPIDSQRSIRTHSSEIDSPPGQRYFRIEAITAVEPPACVPPYPCAPNSFE